jgi:hypothetical protein
VDQAEAGGTEVRGLAQGRIHVELGNWQSALRQGLACHHKIEPDVRIADPAQAQNEQQHAHQNQWTLAGRPVGTLLRDGQSGRLISRHAEVIDEGWPHSGRMLAGLGLGQLCGWRFAVSAIKIDRMNGSLRQFSLA